MAKMKENMEQMQVRKNYRNIWHTDLMGTCTADSGYCCFACFCPYCASYTLRKRALYNDMSRYRCCAGYMPCSGKCGEKHCPELCLCTEVCCCFAPSVSSTRYLLQDELNIQTTKCDNCIIGCMVCLNQLACICQLAACLTCNDELHDLADCLSCIAEIVYCSVCACMQTQHKIELNKRDGKLDPQPVMAVPPMQQMSRTSLPHYADYQHQGSMGYHQPPPMGYQHQGSMGYHHQPPGYVSPPAYGHPISPRGAAYPPQHQHHMYPQHSPYSSGAYTLGPESGPYPPAQPPPPIASVAHTSVPDSSGFALGPESGPYPPARPPPPPSSSVSGPESSGFTPGPESGPYPPALPPPPPASVAAGPDSLGFTPGPESGPYPPAQPPPAPTSISNPLGLDLGFTPGPESGPYPIAQPPPPPPGFQQETPKTHLPTLEEEQSPPSPTPSKNKNTYK